ncbi:MAG: hypothetical protein ACE5GW_12520 [Planctomycetota bacterium]
MLPLCLACIVSGCGILYRHQVSTPECSVYGNAPTADLREIGASIEQAVHAYRRLFPSARDRVAPPRVIYSPDSLARKGIITTETRQEGYYLPFLRLIHLAPRALEEDRSESERLILHELGHHFLISIFPESRSRYWLSEGLACSLEAGFFEDEEGLLAALYHPALHMQARQALAELGEDGVVAEVLRITCSSWFEFHRGAGKGRNYALSWALVHHLLDGLEGRLEERIDAMLRLDDEELRKAVRSLPARISRSLDEELDRLARAPASARWALETWLSAGPADAARFLRHLLPRLSRRRDISVRRHAFGLLSRVLGRPMPGVPGEEREHLVSLLGRRLRGGENEERLAIARALSRDGCRSVRLLSPLVESLEAEDGRLRAAAARALARLSEKPTIVRPSFWTSAPETDRQAEISEWRRWLELRRR